MQIRKTLLYRIVFQVSDRSRLGGSALAQCFGQLGSDVPDVDDAQLFVRAFNVTQMLIKGWFSLSPVS